MTSEKSGEKSGGISGARSGNAQTALVESLNALLADCFALYIKTKNFHWHVKGPNFNDLHLLFDAQAAEIFALTDVIAERVRKNGAATLTSLGAIAALREAKAAATAAGDNATEGAIDDWTDQAERRVWFLGAILG